MQVNLPVQTGKRFKYLNIGDSLLMAADATTVVSARRRKRVILEYIMRERTVRLTELQIPTGNNRMAGLWPSNSDIQRNRGRAGRARDQNWWLKVWHGTTGRCNILLEQTHAFFFAAVVRRGLKT
jgi:hypothetical protein